MTYPAAGTSSPAKSVVLGSLWRSRWLILAAVLVAGVGGYVLSKQQAATYSAQTDVVLSATGGFDPLGQQTGDPSRYVADQLTVIRNPDILQGAATALGDGTTATDIATGLDVTGALDTDVLTITTTGPTPQAAAARADALVAAYGRFVRDHVAAAASAAEAATTDPAVISEIRTRAAAYGDGIAVAQPAYSSGSPSTPNPARDAVLLALVAGVVASGLALLRRPARSRSAGLPENVPVLGTVAVPRGKEGVFDSARYALALVAMDYARAGAPGLVLLTGVSAESRAASVAYGLALSAAAEGRRVLLVDAEPGRRSLTERAGVGVSSASAEAQRRHVTSDGAVLARPPLPVPGTPGLFLTVLGDDEGRPINADLLRPALDRLTQRFDLIIVQSAPVHQSPLAFALVGHADVVVAAMGVKEKPELARRLESRLEATGRGLTGIVLTSPARGYGRGAPQPARPAPVVVGDDSPAGAEEVSAPTH